MPAPLYWQKIGPPNDKTGVNKTKNNIIVFILFKKKEKKKERQQTQRRAVHKVNCINTRHYLALEIMPKETERKIRPTTMEAKRRPSVKPKIGSQAGKDKAGIDV